MRLPNNSSNEERRFTFKTEGDTYEEKSMKPCIIRQIIGETRPVRYRGYGGGRNTQAVEILSNEQRSVSVVLECV